MRIAFYEDATAENFSPIALTRPVFELVCGRFSMRERVLKSLNVTEWGVFLSPHLEESYRESHPEAHVNDLGWLREAPTLFINGRWLPTQDELNGLDHDTSGMIGGTLASFTLDPLDVPLLKEETWDDFLTKVIATQTPTQSNGILVDYPWDLINHNATQLAIDFELCRYVPREWNPGPQVAVMGEMEDIFVDPTALIDPFVVLDARNGPITVDAGAQIQSFTRLEGPCHIGRNSQLFRANVRGATTIGPVCRVGGEVEASVLHGYVNKYHDGFLGHSYLCPWVNLGAMTSNSDLKNDYSNVRVPLMGEMIDSGQSKVGCFLGDHTKTAIGSLFNTGSSIGVMCMVLPNAELLPKHIPSFSRFVHGEFSERFDIEQSLRDARIAMNRRNCELTTSQERLLRRISELTRSERENAFFRFHEKKNKRLQSPVVKLSSEETILTPDLQRS
jgi:UDP-N-acetylglucosamine diphosphorylase/glucosamine-1-phosphate N-acetyltransferase